MGKFEAFLFNLAPKGWIVCRKSTLDSDNQIIADKFYREGRADGLKAGREIGILHVLRYNQKTLSQPKFKESAREFDFERLDAKYPFNPLLEKRP